jgi:O-antigen ligase
MIPTQILASITISLLPAYVVRCKYFDFCGNVSPVPFTLLEVFILITFSTWLVWKISLLKKKKTTLFGPFQGLTRPFIIASSLFLIAGLISVFISPNFRGAAGLYKAYFIEAAMLGLVVYDLTRHKKAVDWLIAPLLFSGVWVAGFAVYQYFTDSVIQTSEALRGRVTSIYVTSNAIGLYLGPLFFLGLGVLKDKLSNKAENMVTISFLVFCLVLYFLAIYFSGSRGAFIALTTGGLFFIGYLLYIGSGRVLKNILKLFFIFLLVTYFLASALILVNFANISSLIKESNNLRSVQSRICLWKISGEVVKEKPIFGTGLASFENTARNNKICDPGIVNYPHNIGYNFWLETGLLGLASFITLVYVVWEGVSRSKSYLAVGIMAALVYIFIHGIVDVPYFKNDLSSQFWVFTAIVAWLNKENGSNLLRSRSG